MSAATFARALARLGHDADIYAPAYSGCQDVEPNVHRLHALPRPARVMYPLALPFGTAFPEKVPTQYPPDIAHANHPFLTGRDARRLARRLGRPLVFTYHTIVRDYAH